MDENNKTNKNYIIAAIVFVVVVLIGVGIYAAFNIDMNKDDNTSKDDNSRTKKDETTSVQVGGAAMLANRNIVDNVSNASNLTTLVTAVKAADLVDALKADGPLTVFGPTNTAFDKLPAGTVETLLKPENKSQLQSILTFHVVSGKYTAKDLKDGQKLKTLQGDELVVRKDGGKTYINGALIETPDVLQSNGVAHVINSVLIPPASSTNVGGVAMIRANTIAQNVVNAPNLSTLVTAVQAAGLVDTLNDKTAEFTVFGPDNAAFAKLPGGTVESLVLPASKDKLLGILTYHVVPGVYSSSQLYDGQVLTTVNGQTLTIRKNTKGTQVLTQDGKVTANIITPDVFQANGVAHVIDSVLIPVAR